MSDGPQPDPASAAGSSAWAPFRHPLFAAMWGAQFVSNIGSWMQTVGAQWLMISLNGSATYVALVQSAASLPVVLFAVAAGTIGDLVDRRRFLLVTQSLMLVAAIALGVLTIEKLVSPWTLLALIFAVGTGQALTSPTWQTLQPELVDPDERTQAISLGAVNQNLARAVGPAIGGLVLAAAGSGSDFLINAASFGAVIAVISWWRSAPRPDAVPREHVGEAVRAGARYVRNSPTLRAVMARSGLFVVFASAIWALLPLTARHTLHLGSGGYGLLLGAVGIGAVIGAVLLPRLRRSLTPDWALAGSSLALAAVALLIGLVHVKLVVAFALVVGGVSWILALSTLNSIYQLSLPRWIKARGMAFYLVVFQGGNAVGSAAMGVSAEQLGLRSTYGIAAGGLVASSLAGLLYHFHPIAPEDLVAAGDWPQPQLTGDAAPHGPVLVTLDYHAAPGQEEDLIAALEAARFSRRRTGAASWRVWRDSDEPSRILEQFVVASWSEHLRQHGRVTRHDQSRLDHIASFTDPDQPTVVTHWLAPEPT